MLRRFSDNYLILYLVGCVVPTILEYLTARVMLLVFHEVWWDYTNKPFNYKGILCLESTLAWGLYTVGLFAFLHKGVTAAVEYVPFTFGIYVATVVLAVEGVDFLYHLIQAKTDALPHNVKELRESLRVFR